MRKIIMEVRTVLEGKVYILWMNPITGNAEDIVAVAASSDYHRLMSWYGNQKCEPWRDSWMNKQFKQGSPLEYFNPVPTLDLNPNTTWHHGIYEKWIRVDSGYNPNPPFNSSIHWLG